MIATAMPAASRRPAAQCSIDTDWLMAQIQRSPFGSQNQLAPHILGRHGPLAQSQFSRALRGERDFTVPELVQLARLLRVELREVLLHAGVPKGDL